MVINRSPQAYIAAGPVNPSYGHWLCARCMQSRAHCLPVSANAMYLRVLRATFAFHADDAPEHIARANLPPATTTANKKTLLSNTT